MKVLIIGGVAGGATTAARLRRMDEHAEIILFERGEYISYANCGLPYYIGGTIPNREQLFVQTPKSFSARFNIDIRVRSEITNIDRMSKTVSVRDHINEKSYIETYDKLVLSPGAEPVRPPIPGIDSRRIFTLRNVPDTDKIKEYIMQHKVKRAIIVGAGFIGLEMAENLNEQGIFVTIVEMARQVMNLLDYEMASVVHQHLKTKNVEFYLEDAVSEFKETKKGLLEVKLKSGRTLPADLVILSIGVTPDTKLAKEAGLQIGAQGGIWVNEFMQTSDPDIFALGDAVEFQHRISGTPMKVPLAGPANKQGRIVADNIIFGLKRKFKGPLGTGIAKVFDITVASTGLSEKVLKSAAIPYKTCITHSANHAGYYPGAIPMSIKTIFSPGDGRLLGAQIVGYHGVDKRIDIMAAVMGEGGTVYDLQEVEHAYAPPYSSAKDPVNIAGFVAGNILEGLSDQVSWREVYEKKLGEGLVLDVRTPQEFSRGTVDGAVNIPVDELRSRLDELPKDKKIAVLCGVGLRAYVAERILKQNGFSDVVNMSGGWKTYSLATMKQSNEDIFEGDYIGIDDGIYQAPPENK